MFVLREVVIETTKQCNLNCLHCGSDCGHCPVKNELSIADWKSILIQLAKLNVKKIVFSGGEPTLKPGFIDLIIFAHSLGLKFGFISNGFLIFDESLQQAIIKSQPFAIGLSIDGLKTTHNKIRQNNNSWSNLIKNISLLQKLKMEICIITTLNQLNYLELPQLARFLNLAEIDSWQLQLALPVGRMKQQADWLLTEAQFKEICQIIMELRQLYPKLNIQTADCFGLAPADSIRSEVWGGCTAGLSSLAIDCQGKIIPCLSWQDTLIYEDTNNKRIAEIWNNSSIFDFNRHFKAETVVGKCVSCQFLNNCRGGCNSQSLAYYNYLHSSPFCFYKTYLGEKNECY